MLIRCDVQCENGWYQALANDPHLSGAKANLEVMWRRFRPFADSHFETQLLVDFHARFWEIWLGNMMLDQGLQLLKRKDRGPDLGAELPSGRVLWIEAVTPGPGSGKDRVQGRPTGGLSWVPTERIVLRLRSAIEDKLRRIRQYIADEEIGPEDSVVLAINPRKIDYTISDAEPSFALQCVYPIGAPYATFDKSTLAQTDQGYTFRPTITKAKGAPVQTGVFTEGRSAPLAALLFSLVDAYRLNRHRPETVEDYSCYLVHNAMASNPVPCNALAANCEARVTRSEEDWSLNWHCR